MPTLTTTGKRKLKINKLTKTQMDAVVSPSATELYCVDPEFTGGKGLQTDANGDVVESAVTSTEFGYLSGVTSSIQTQLNGKQETLTVGTGIDITSGTISVTTHVLQNIATGTQSLQIANNNTLGIGSYGLTTYGLNINAVGSNSSIFGRNVVSRIGSNGSATGVSCFGANSNISANGVTHIGAYGTNSEAGSFSVSVSSTGNATDSHTYIMMDVDGEIPAGRLTKAIQGAITSTTITLTSAGWSSNTQTVSVTGMTASSIVWVSPAGASMSDYASAGVYCSAQASGTLTFTCTSAPSSDLTVQVVFG